MHKRRYVIIGQPMQYRDTPHVKPKLDFVVHSILVRVSWKIQEISRYMVGVFYNGADVEIQRRSTNPINFQNDYKILQVRNRVLMYIKFLVRRNIIDVHSNAIQLRVKLNYL